MLSVFNKRSKTYSQSKKKFSTITGIRRAQSPPSPASFVSPEIVEINEQGPFGGSFPEDRAPSLERPAAAAAASVASPQLKLSFDASEPLFPPSILSQTQPGSRTPPKRNVSLPNGGRAVPDGNSTRAREENTIWEEPLQPNRLQVDTTVQNSRSFEDISESSAAHSIRKPTPSPIRIPNNSTSAKIRVQSSAEESAGTSKNLPPPLPTRPPSPSSAVTDDISSAVSGTSMARALVATSFVLSNESRASKYKSGMTRQDSATLPRGEHPLINSPYMRERRASSGEPGSARSSSVPPVPRLPSRAELGLSIDGASSGMKSQRNSVTLVLENGDNNQLVPPPQLKRPKSTGRLRMEQTISMPPISPISEASSPAPSVPETPGLAMLGTTNVSNTSSRSLANPLAQQRGLNLSESNTSLSSLGTESSNHARAATEPGVAYSSAGERRPSNATKPKGPMAPGYDRNAAAMPGTMRSSGAFAVTNGRLAVTRTISESGVPRNQTSGPTRPAVLLPIGERPASVLVPPSPKPSITSTRVGPNPPVAETPVDSPDLLDSFPLQIARERSAGPPPPLPLGRRSEDNNVIPTPLQSSSGESISGASMNRQTFPETPNAFSPLWSGTFASPPTSAPRSSLDQSLVGRNGSMMRAPGFIDMTRMAPRGAAGRVSSSIFAKPSTRSSRVPPTPPLTGESTNGSQPDSPVTEDHPVPLAIKRLTAIEEQVASRSVSQYSTIPEPPTSGAQFGGEAFLVQQLQQQEQRQQQQLQQPPAAKPRGGRERSESVSAHSRDGSVAASQAQSQAPTQLSSNQSAAAQAKAAEASSHRRMRSVTNPDEPLASPPPSYPATFDPNTLAHPRAGTADSSEQSFRSSIHSSSTHLQASSSQSSIPQKRSLSPFPSPPPSSIPLPPSPGRSRMDAHASSISVEQPPPPYMEMARISTPPVPPVPTPPTPPTPPTHSPAPSPAPNSRFVIADPPAPPSTPLRAAFTPDSTPSKRLPRTRPPLPHGPRKPSQSSAAARMRAGSVSSVNSNVAGGSSRLMSMTSHSAPRFQPSRVNFRGLTMEAAQWTLTSQQLQHIVSTAIRQSADASAIRILPQDTLERELPTEMDQLEARARELKTNYKLSVRRRNAMLATLSRIAEGTEHVEPGTATRVAEELSDLNEYLDLAAEELYTVTDQLGQLARLRDLHQRSALAMALRKLNNSFLKQVGEVQRLRDMVETLEAERDEAWQEAQEVAQEFDDFTERIMVEPAPSSSSATPSRRSSRVMIVRKNSQRASKAGLRSSMYRRSQRSSTASSHRYSGAASPGAWVPPGNSEDIPPVPPIPIRRDLIRLPSGDLPTRSSMDSPSSELRAMVQAQKELCEMLGISLEELKVTHQPSRRQSMSALPGPKSPASAAPTRRNSDIVTPNHQRTFKV